MAKSTSNWGKRPFEVTTEATTFTTIQSGRTRWALECLIAAGESGCTPIDHPGPRWSDYVFRLRGDGIDIETVTEPHGGPFKGTHARYVLRSRVKRIHREAAV